MASLEDNRRLIISDDVAAELCKLPGVAWNAAMLLGGFQVTVDHNLGPGQAYSIRSETLKQIEVPMMFSHDPDNHGIMIGSRSFVPIMSDRIDSISAISPAIFCNEFARGPVKDIRLLKIRLKSLRSQRDRLVNILYRRSWRVT